NNVATVVQSLIFQHKTDIAKLQLKLSFRMRRQTFKGKSKAGSIVWQIPPFKGPSVVRTIV
ncbi:MAG TPA: hypothetical protein VET48_06995, partial [Steroidobacteraceae bacterium]|nr:hypothetical protein [Steroidobacteraceae bacterium]